MMLLRRGSTGEAVKFLQGRLTAHGFTVRVDGVFGQATENAVRQFQAAQNLKVDGVVGDKTWDALRVDRRVELPGALQHDERHALYMSALEQLDADSPSQQRRLMVLRTAIDQLGLREEPRGSNSGPQINHIVQGYWKQRGVVPEPATAPPWCAIFVSWCLKTGLDVSDWGEIPFGDWLGGVSEIYRWAQKQAKTRPEVWHKQQAEYTVQTGEIFVMSRGGSGSDVSRATSAGHCGFVVTDLGDGHVLTVEGNVSDQVMSRRRRKSTLTGFVRWWAV